MVQNIKHINNSTNVLSIIMTFLPENLLMIKLNTTELKEKLYKIRPRDRLV